MYSHEIQSLVVLTPVALDAIRDQWEKAKERGSVSPGLRDRAPDTILMLLDELEKMRAEMELHHKLQCEAQDAAMELEADLKRQIAEARHHASARLQALRDVEMELEDNKKWLAEALADNAALTDELRRQSGWDHGDACEGGDDGCTCGANLLNLSRDRVLASIHPGQALFRELDRARRETDSLLQSLVFSEQILKDIPNWEPLDTIGGRVSQINNIITGINQDRARMRTELEAARAVIEAVKRLKDYGVGTDRAVYFHGANEDRWLFDRLYEAYEAAKGDR